MADRTAELKFDTAGACSTRIEEAIGPSPTRIRNRPLETLESEAWSVIQPHLERVTLPEGQLLEAEGQRSTFLYFPTQGGVSLEVGPGKRTMQLALVGREGLIGTCLLLGGLPSARAWVQFKGAAWRVSADPLQSILEESPQLRRHLLLAVNAFLHRLSRVAWANGRTAIENRLAHWLLAAADCLDASEVPVTHQALSDALGVRRSSVTIALHALEATGAVAVRSHRACIRIRDHQRLAAIAEDYLRSSSTRAR